MKLALFDDNRLGVVSADDSTVVDVTDALPWPHDPDPLTAGWWRALCRDFADLSPALRSAAESGPARPLAQVTLRAPALGPTKVVAAASNYGEHVAEMHDGAGADAGPGRGLDDGVRRLPQGAVVHRRPGADVSCRPTWSPPGRRSTTSPNWSSSSAAAGRTSRWSRRWTRSSASPPGWTSPCAAPRPVPPQELRLVLPARALAGHDRRAGRRLGPGHPAHQRGRGAPVGEHP